MSSEQQAAGATAEQPLYFRWVRDDEGVKWGNVLLALGLTMLTAYLSVATQRKASSADFERSLRMAVARKKITAGVRLQRAGKRLEEAGWAAYEAARP